MKNQQEYEASLYRYGLKNTRPRRLVFDLLRQQAGLVTAEELHQLLLQNGETVNASTVYRTLDLFAAKRLVEKTFLPQLHRYGFSLAAPGHIHHLICIRCHKKIDLAGCPLQSYEKNVAAATDFTITGHQLVLYGICRDCREKETVEREKRHEQ